jgi:putative endonuclease
MAIVYILYSAEQDAFYVGHTTDNLDERIRRHLSDHKGFTSRAKDWRLVHHEVFVNKREGFKREREIKKWKSSIRIRKLISALE